MIGLQVTPGKQALRVLCIGAHCDDVEIGCAGTLLHLQRTYGKILISWVVLSGSKERRAETIMAMKRLVKPASRGELVFGDFPDARFPARYAEIKEFFGTLPARCRPDIVFSHERDDAHQDHRIVNELTWGAFRNHLVLEYEIIKWDGNFATPNVYVPLTASIVRRKLDVLMSVYGSQRSKDWFTADTFLSVMRLRGIECRAPTGYAEAYSGRKLSLLPG